MWGCGLGTLGVAVLAAKVVVLARPGTAWLTLPVQPVPEGLDDEVGGLVGVGGG